jgi:hypothetical protein
MSSVRKKGRIAPASFATRRGLDYGQVADTILIALRRM